MPIDRFIDLFHVKHTNRPGLPGRLRFSAPVSDGIRPGQGLACT